MFEKNMHISFLLDFYGEILPEKAKRVLSSYYNDDLSLSEIASFEGISRQGVRSIIKKGEEDLLFYEEKLGLAQQFSNLQEQADLLEKDLNKLPKDSPLYINIKRLIDTIQNS